MLHMAQTLVNPVGVCFFTAHSVNWGRREEKKGRGEKGRRGWRGGAERKGKREGKEWAGRRGGEAEGSP